MHTISTRASKRDATTISIRRSIRRTIFAAARHESIVYKNGMSAQPAALYTPNAARTQNNTEGSWPYKIATSSVQNVDGMITGSMYGEEKEAVLSANAAAA